MKKFYAVLSLVLMFCFALEMNAQQKFDVNLPLKGESIASKQLQLDTLKAVYAVSGDYNKNCQSYSVVDTKLIHHIKDGSGKDGRYLTGYWREAWIVNRCSQQIAVPVLFTLDGKGGAYYSISPSEAKRIK